MPGTHFDVIAAPDLLKSLPVRLDQSFSRASPLVLLTVLAPLAALAFFPFALIALHAAASRDGVSAFVNHPAAALQAVAALTLFAVLLGWPMATLIGKLTTRRTVTIEPGIVHVIDHRIFGTTAWSAALSSFSGVNTQVRTSLSGFRHELVLSHPQRERSILIRVSAQQFAAGEIASITNVLRQSGHNAGMVGQHRQTVEYPSPAITITAVAA